ncbi:MAG TPA: hypothetical protein VN903_01570 [Polyangia bacterium]|jgi:hypothetical protein|nr:hypothetical protein [Polyangia bacterium]
MRTRWEELHAGLLRSIDGRASVESFAELQGRSPALAPFSGPVAVADFLVNRRNGIARRDRVLRCLVEETRGGRAKRTALAIVLLGLWPALDAIFRKRSHLFQREAHDIEMEIIEHLIAQVQRIDLARVACLAATLVRNTERDVVDARVRERTRAAKSDAVTPDAIVAPAIDDELVAASRFGLSVGQSEAQHVTALRSWLQSAVGHDADLVVEAVINQRSRVELAASLKISHAAARKRLERALDRARHAFLAQPSSRPTLQSAWVSQ